MREFKCRANLMEKPQSLYEHEPSTPFQEYVPGPREFWIDGVSVSEEVYKAESQKDIAHDDAVRLDIILHGNSYTLRDGTRLDQQRVTLEVVPDALHRTPRIQSYRYRDDACREVIYNPEEIIHRKSLPNGTTSIKGGTTNDTF